MLAALVSSSGAAYEQPLANIDYVLSHYHALVKDAFAAMLADDTAGAVEAYGQAHQVMAETLLPEADFVDKANSYVLNDSYDTQNARSASTAPDRGVVARPAGVPGAGQVLVARGSGGWSTWAWRWPPWWRWPVAPSPSTASATRRPPHQGT